MKANYIYFAPVEVQSIGISGSVCLTTLIPQKHIKLHKNFLYMLNVAMARSSSNDITICHDDSTISIISVIIIMTITSGLSLASLYHIIETMGQNQRQRYVLSSSSGSST